MPRVRRWQTNFVDCLPLRGRWLGYLVGVSLVGLGNFMIPVFITDHPSQQAPDLVSHLPGGGVMAIGLLIIVSAYLWKR